jgi:hypothetical protein
MVPAAAILIARRIGLPRGSHAPSTRGTVAVGACAAALAVAVAWADLAYANSARVAAKRIHDKYGGRGHDVVFTGHWGFQYYMEALGAKAANIHDDSASVGDILVVPEENSSAYKPEASSAVRLVETIEVPSSRWISTMRSGAGFYADDYGPVPFVLGEVPRERYMIFRASLPGE